MSTPVSYPLPISLPLFTQLVHRLRLANARYDQIAYQCRHAYRPTHHAKRRAYRAGLRIYTSKASPLSVPPISVCISAAQEAEQGKGSALDLVGGGIPEAIAPKSTESPCLPPLDLALIGFGVRIGADGGDLPFHGPVPGAPRLRPRPLPDVECGPEVASSLRSRRYDPVGLGITMSQRRVRRKLRNMDD